MTLNVNDNEPINGDVEDEENDCEDEIYDEDNGQGDVSGMVEGLVGLDDEDDRIRIDGLVDILNMDMKNITNELVERLDFADLEAAYLFYSWYSQINGFSVRKSQVLRNKMGEKIQQTFVCSRAGKRQNRGLTLESRKREAKNEIRCDCGAMFRVHIHIDTGRWYVTVFIFDHNHVKLDINYAALLPAHRKMSAIDIMQIENFQKVGIRPPHMYAAFANNAGGYHKVGFVSKDIYNQSGKQRRQKISDVNGALNYLRDLCSKDPLMYVAYTVDDSNRLQHLFWCDGESQMNYQVFGDVLAFDATYKKNKYLCPFVVLSGINHHNQTIVFGACLVSNETEETYEWLLEQFLEAMKGKAPTSVITDGDLAMKNAIRKVFPNTHHRLCAWHLLRNAVSNVGIPEFMPYLKACMLGDLDVYQFEKKWIDMVVMFGLEENKWMKELYEKRNMWSTALIRGHFFAGIRTTSRCEAFHSHIGKFIHSRINLTEFVQQFHRCLSYFRFREVEADFQSNYREVVLQSSYRALERSAAKHLTKELFLIFWPFLKKASLLRVVDCQGMSMSSVFTVVKFYSTTSIWHVTYCPSLVEFRCSCLRMESIGLPCDHIISVLLCLKFQELPKCLLLNRWSKWAKDEIRGSYGDVSNYWNSYLMARYASLVHISRELCDYAHRDEEDYNHVIELLTSEVSRLKLKHAGRVSATSMITETEHTQFNVEDPVLVRSKGCGANSNIQGGRVRRAQTCRTCGRRGHNRRSCTNVGRNVNDQVCETIVASSAIEGDNEYPDCSDYNEHLANMHPDTFIPSSSRAAKYC